jgi:hypothetical protein
VRSEIRALDRLERCREDRVIYADRLNVGPCRLVEGFGERDRTVWFAIDYQGEFQVHTAGNYEFRLVSDDGAILWIDGEEIVDNDGLHGPRSRIGSIPLTPGKHRIRVLYLQGPEAFAALQLFVTPPGREERLWGAEI